MKVQKCIESIKRASELLSESNRSDTASVMRECYRDMVQARNDIEKITQNIIGISKRIDQIGKSIDDDNISKDELAMLEKSYSNSVQVVRDLMDSKNSLIGVAAPILTLIKKFK